MSLAMYIRRICNVFFKLSLPFGLLFVVFWFLLASCSMNRFVDDVSVTGARESNGVEEVVVSGIRASIIEAEDVARDYVFSEQKKFSQASKTWRKSNEHANAAVLKVGDNENIEPEAVDITVKIDGFRARVVVTGFYMNPHNAQLEGDFKYRLPDSAKPYYFAFGEAINFNERNLLEPIEIDASRVASGFLEPIQLSKANETLWKAPKEAVMVARQKAAFAYEDTVSRQVDPALMEWSGAGVFSASVFPLVPNSIHRVVIGYDVDLVRQGEQLFLDLPLTDKAITKRVHLVFGSQQREQQKLIRVVNGELQTGFYPDVVNGVVQSTLEGDRLTGVRVMVDSPRAPVLVGLDDVGGYFATRWMAQLPETGTQTNERGIFLLDSSLSAEPERFHLWVATLQAILKANEATLLEFAVASFSLDAHWWQPQYVANTEANREALKAYLNRLVLEGATNLNAALQTVVSNNWAMSGATPDIFLMSDGAITWGERDLYAISHALKPAFNGRILCYRLGLAGENSTTLEHLAREFGGASFVVTDETEIPRLATAHTQLPWTLVSVQLDGASDILLRGRPTMVYPGQLLTIAGRREAELGKTLTLLFESMGKQLSVEVPITGVLASSLTARMYGVIATEQLESLGDLETALATAYANHFRVPGRSSSLLMLESQDDYQRYNITPQQDAYAVQTALVGSVFDRLDSSFAELLADPKRRFLKRIENYASAPGVELEIPEPLQILIRNLPEDVFERPKSLLATRPQSRTEVPFEYQQALMKEAIYASVVEEAARRANSLSPGDALKVMSSLVERAPSDVVVLRDVAFAAENWGLPAQAFLLHEQALDMRPFEPLSYSYLARLAEKMGNLDLALLYYELGAAGQWPERFATFKKLHEMDYYSFLQRAMAQPERLASVDYAKGRLSQLQKTIGSPADLVVAISWNTDRTDIDLHVKEPGGEECYYKNSQTRSGGELSDDITTGYGPEFYINRDAPSGRYRVYVKYFSDDRNKLGLTTKVFVRFIRHWGTDELQETSKTVVLESAEQKQLVFKSQI